MWSLQTHHVSGHYKPMPLCLPAKAGVLKMRQRKKNNSIKHLTRQKKQNALCKTSLNLSSSIVMVYS